MPGDLTNTPTLQDGVTYTAEEAQAWFEDLLIGERTVTPGKLMEVGENKLLGRSSPDPGDVEEIPVTSTGRQLINCADKAAVRTFLEIAGTTSAVESDFETSFGLQEAGTTSDGETTHLLDHADAPSVTIGSGVWLVIGTVGLWLIGAGQQWARFHDGSEEFGGSNASIGNGSGPGNSHCVLAVITVPSEETKTLRFNAHFYAAAGVGYRVGSLLSTGLNNGPAGQITAIRLNPPS